MLRLKQGYWAPRRRITYIDVEPLARLFYHTHLSTLNRTLLGAVCKATEKSTYKRLSLRPECHRNEYFCFERQILWANSSVVLIKMPIWKVQRRRNGIFNNCRCISRKTIHLRQVISAADKAQRSVFHLKKQELRKRRSNSMFYYLGFERCRVVAELVADSKSGAKTERDTCNSVLHPNLSSWEIWCIFIFCNCNKC